MDAIEQDAPLWHSRLAAILAQLNVQRQDAGLPRLTAKQWVVECFIASAITPELGTKLAEIDEQIENQKAEAIRNVKQQLRDQL